VIKYRSEQGVQNGKISVKLNGSKNHHRFYANKNFFAPGFAKKIQPTKIIRDNLLQIAGNFSLPGVLKK